eukprot:gnl/MRDRNA2_/MRDRNA2_115745_c0_seq1.p1 gnl/MRDRNA2_/MRDRNA2_115745_c0~~gnl/MRDRNA2_/MRDRNA2_115745_c0_seq1.p1  ORF type:complete len:319 (+),score=37.84 gnl/MRDRNA2_/MRDRNA2_115745_c0_seq1:62-1018(+)
MEQRPGAASVHLPRVPQPARTQFGRTATTGKPVAMLSHALSDSDLSNVRAPLNRQAAVAGGASSSNVGFQSKNPRDTDPGVSKADAFLRRFATLNENCRGYGCAAHSFHENAVASWLRVGAAGIKKGPSRKKQDMTNRTNCKMTYIPPRDISKTPESVAQIEARRSLKLVYNHILKTMVDPYAEPECDRRKAIERKDPWQRTRSVYLHDQSLPPSALASTATTVSSTPLGSARLEPYHKPNKALTELSKGCLGSPWTWGLVKDNVEARINGLKPVLEGVKRAELKSSWRKTGDGVAAMTLKTLPYSWSLIEPLPIANA